MNKAQSLNTRLDVDFALKAAQLGVWELDPISDSVIWDDRCCEIFGIPKGNTMPYEEAIGQIHPEDVERVDEAVKWAMDPASGGLYDVTYRTVGVEDGIVRWVRFIGRSYFDEAGNTLRFAGIAQEMTQEMEARRREQALTESREREREEKPLLLVTVSASEAKYRQLSEELDKRVQQRTTELDAMNRDLIRSNQNLEKFAYIASHDLQEPLRKIQAFGDLLRSQQADSLGKGLDYLQRMQSAANRMSVLISDLLTYSQISTRQQAANSVILSHTISQVLENLSLAVAETNAKIVVGELPVVQGDSTQLSQLFQNLLSNALKFRQKDESGVLLNPVVAIRSEEVLASELPPNTKPARQSEVYNRIQVSDEGVGFEEKYSERIFQVFQRLHSRSEYPGTGVGLAICEKVAFNHGGAITLISQPNQGTMFSVFLPKT